MASKFPTALIMALATMALSACGMGRDEETVRVAFIGQSSNLVSNGMRLSPAGQQLRAATAAGLVTLDENGSVVPALAERWIITDDGLSYIFRLRNARWADGSTLTGGSAQAALERNLRDLAGTSLGLDLSIISDVRTMTGRVIEIRLKSQMPEFLQLMAQPEMGLRHGGKGAGPMTAEQAEGQLRLSVSSPDFRGPPENADWRVGYRDVALASLPAERATQAFEEGAADVVLNGQIATFPMADTGPLSSGTVRLDAVFGLFGLQFTNSSGLLAEPARREAIAMAIDRTTLMQRFNIGGWVPSTRIVPADLPGRGFVAQERWSTSSLEERRVKARDRLSTGDSLELTIALPEGPGSELLLASLDESLSTIGITLVRVANDQRPDLRLVDRLARFADDRWFLNQFNCSLKRGLCSQTADEFVVRAMRTKDAAERAALFRSAEQALLDANVFIPLGAPVRWSLIRGGVDGFAENRWGLHPLFPMAVRPK